MKKYSGDPPAQGGGGGQFFQFFKISFRETLRQKSGKFGISRLGESREYGSGLELKEQFSWLSSCSGIGGTHQRGIIIVKKSFFCNIQHIVFFT